MVILALCAYQFTVFISTGFIQDNIQSGSLSNIGQDIVSANLRRIHIERFLQVISGHALAAHYALFPSCFPVCALLDLGIPRTGRSRSRRNAGFIRCFSLICSQITCARIAVYIVERNSAFSHIICNLVGGVIFVYILPFAIGLQHSVSLFAVFFRRFFKCLRSRYGRFLYIRCGMFVDFGLNTILILR